MEGRLMFRRQERAPTAAEAASVQAEWVPSAMVARATAPAVAVALALALMVARGQATSPATVV